jgi:hypothetical protein
LQQSRAHHTEYKQGNVASLLVDLRENLEDFRKVSKMIMFLFPLLHILPTFHKTNMLHNDLKKDAINEYGIKLLKTKHCIFQISGA